MMTSENTQYTLPDFDLGRQDQIDRAIWLREQLLTSLIFEGYDVNDIQLLLSIRTSAKWWWDNQKSIFKPSLYPRLIKVAKRYVETHGSIEAAAKAQRAQFEKQLVNAKLRKPMYEWNG